MPLVYCRGRAQNGAGTIIQASSRHAQFFPSRICLDEVVRRSEWNASTGPSRTNLDSEAQRSSHHMRRISKLVIATAFVGVLSVPCFAREKDRQQAQQPSIKPFDCPSGAGLVACNSFREMLRAHDPDITEKISRDHTKTYVCFEPEGDTFLVLSYGVPTHWTKDTKDDTFVAKYQTLRLADYKNGVSSSFVHALLLWTATPDLGISSMAADTDSLPSSKRKPITASIDDAEVSISYSFDNVEGTTTGYSLQVRRATKRFAETYFVNSKHSSQSTRTGYCAEFGDGTPAPLPTK